MSKEAYNVIRSSKYLRESDVFKKGELFHLSEKQVAKVTKAMFLKRHV